jgi:protein-S-isoprenylcysteine O-methyltransferase Ste14
MMARGLSQWLFVAGILPALVLGCLAAETTSSHPTGWLLVASSAAYLAIVALRATWLRDRAPLQTGRRAWLWLALSGSMGVCFAGPAEHLIGAELLPASEYLEPAGAVCTAGGMVLAAWTQRARRQLHRLREGGRPVAGWALGGPYRTLRYPGFAALLILALGLALGYGSLAACALVVFLVLPALVLQIGCEEYRKRALLCDEGYRRYTARTARLVPGVW